ncbi:Bifunctional inhibitor/plant lipid transfer protein/seed storage helical domain-containing protein [Artemisia annua]|uniref:Bifunctional inhibitor/plant lipid transfer protein/seed storage helical domain-containing protein n=1 Tax=Artemisia annua TaxID=35608 RepID=A0A2U1MMS7_ARTAN|nr:Bifunctional inhibitor/plant lipid transfer protein/seed storage helical domain-containing protein [Artemisia annua]WLD47580.1 glycosylphosphatidylinositol-anchored lipid transfer protein 1 [Artemisia annua]
MVNSNTTIMVLAMLVGLILIGLPALEAQSPMGAPMMSPGTQTTTPPMGAPTGAPDCLTALANVSDCLTFVQVGSNLTKPDKACCPEFAGLLESNPICLCSLIGQSDQYGVDLNRALMLPDACKVEIPSLDNCPAAPVSAPGPSIASEAPGSTAAGPMPDGGAALGPDASGTAGTNGASSNAVRDLSTVICLAVAIFIAYYF